MFHTNEGKSKITGTVGKGKLENGWLLPYSGPNFRYYSPISYYLLDRAYVHDKVYQTMLGAYHTLETTCPGTQFRVMDCARREGGGVWPHRTHQIGMSVDFMVPLQRVQEGAAAGAAQPGSGAAPDQFRWLDRIGIWHYLLQFDEQGKWSEGIAIDFDTMGKQLLALDDAARANGLRVQKVILKINLKDEFFASPSGRKLKNRGVYFARALPELVDELHDDHYHVDFKLD